VKHISLFSGIGGFDLAAQWAGWDNLASCEINPFGRRHLAYYWPEAYHHDDIKTLTGEIIEHEAQKRYDPDWRADGVILSGGFPCQPYSLAGKRLGKEDERHLWPEMLRVIQEVKPTWIVGENVFGLVNWSDGLVFDDVQTDLEAAGYEVQAYVLPACAANAPHRRDRVWIVAYAANIGQKQPRNTRERRPGFEDSHSDEKRFSTYANGIGQPGEKHGHQESGFSCENSKGISWHDFPIEPPVCSRNDGLSAELDGITFSKWRNESIKAAGNAIVPQIAYRIFQTINNFTQHNTHGTQFEQAKPQTNACARE
jgi:DNA (cytosine-5)-methyltransferase 1